MKKKTTLQFVLLGNPISVNMMYRGRRFLTPAGKNLKESYGWQVKQQFHQKLLTQPIAISLKVYLDSKRMDLDNTIKAIFDSLTGTLWKDDRQVEKIIAEKFMDRKNPRVEIEIKKTREYS